MADNINKLDPPLDTTDTKCDVCGGLYGGNKLYIMATCRHSYCGHCLEMFRAKGIPCWKCSIQVDLDAFDSIVAPSEIFKEKNQRSSPEKSEDVTPEEVDVLFKSQLEEVKKDFIMKRSFLALNLGVITDYVQSVNNNLEEIDALMETISKGTWEDNIEKFRTLSDRYVVLRDRTSMRYGIPMVVCNLPLCKFSSSEEYIKEVYMRLKDKKEVYAAHRIHHHLLYAKFSEEFSLEGEKIKMHAFRYLDIPEDSTVLSFEDFKKVYCKQETMQTFFRIFCIKVPTMLTIYINMNNSRNSSRFMKFCSGEFGESFNNKPANPNPLSVGSSGPEKAMKESKESLSCFLKFRNSCSRKNLPREYYQDHLEEDSETLYKGDDCIVRLCPDDTIGFFNVLGPRKKYKAVGIVSSPKDLFCTFPQDPTKKVMPDKIYDCGLSMTIPKM